MKKNKIKSYNYLLVLAVIAFLFAFAGFILAITFRDYELLINIISLVLLGLGTILTILRAVLVYKKDKRMEADLAKINAKLILYNAGIKEDKLELNNDKLKDINDNVNNLSLTYKNLVMHYVYDNNFYDYVKDYFKRNEDINFVYMRIRGADINLEELYNLFPSSYYGKHYDELDVVVIHYVNKDIIKEKILKYLEEHEDYYIRLVYYPETALEDIEKEIENLKGDARLLINNAKNRQGLIGVIDEYMSINFADPTILTKFIKDAFPYLPYTHMAILINGEYLRLATYDPLNQLSKENDFYIYERKPLLTYQDKQVEVVFASIHDIPEIDKSTSESIRLFLLMLSNLITLYLDRDTQNALIRTHDKLLDYLHAYSYTVDEKYVIKFASPLLEEKFIEPIVGKLCHKALFGLDEPCENCPLIKGALSRNATFLGSGTYNHLAFSNGGNYDVYLFDDKHNIIGSKELLDERLLSLINQESKGYLFCVKIENLESVASKNKVDPEVIMNQLLDALRKYHLDDNLYRKADDELVYILEEVHKEDAIRLGNLLSRCFNEKFLANTRYVNLVIKTILLSYPLEVSTLFDLESLSRTLFAQAEKKGRLYRLDEDPTPIDKHKYYLEILENSFKNDHIPLIISNVLDNKDKNNNLSYLSLDYKDESLMPIKEDEITLVAKQENYYGTLTERLIRQLNYDKGQNYIIYYAREGMNNRLIDSLAGIIKRKKGKNEQIIFLLKEKDYYSHIEEAKHAQELGFRFALNTISLAENDYKDIYYIEVDDNRYEKDIAYQGKINNIKDKCNLFGKGFRFEK